MSVNSSALPMLRRYAGFVTRHPVAIMLFAAIATVFLASRLMSLVIDMSQDTWVPQNHPYVTATRSIEHIFGGRNITIIGITARHGDIYQPAILAKIQRIQRGIENLPSAVRHNVVSLAAAKVKDIKGTADGMSVIPMMEQIPRTAAEMEALKRRVAESPFYANTLVSPDGKSAAIVADFRVDPDKPSYAKLFKEIKHIVQPEADDTVIIRYGGLPVDFAWFEGYMMRMPMYFGIALLVIMAIQYWSFRSLQGMLLPVVTAITSVIWALGIMGTIGVHMDGMNTTTPILIMAIAAGHSIQILKRYYEEFNARRLAEPGISLCDASRSAVVESIARVGPVMITAGFIAAITFYSLSASGVPAARHFGIFAGSGVLAAMALEMTLIPALRSLLPPPRGRETRGNDRLGILDRLLAALADRLASGKAPLILALTLAAILLAFSGVFRLSVDNSLLHYNQPGSVIRTDDHMLNQAFAGTNTIFFLIQGKHQDALKNPRVLEAMEKLQSFLNSQPYVGKTQSIADLIKRMNMATHGDHPQYDKIPPDQALISQYLFLYSLSGGPRDFDSLVDNDYRHALIWVFLKSDSTAYAQSLYQHASQLIAREFPKDVTVQMGGSLPETIAGNQELVDGKLLNIAQMAIVVLILGSLALRSLVGGLFVVTPLVMVVMANLGIMGWLGVSLDMGTATTAAMAISIGADYELYLLFRFREEYARTGSIAEASRRSLMTAGKAVIFIALSVAAGYGTLFTSGFGFYTRLATMVVSTMAVSAITALVLLRAMAVVFRPRFIFGSAPSGYPAPLKLPDLPVKEETP